jgi:hydrogenase-4 component F
MGLAPLHTWLPDAHSEAPSVASALFSGALLNCALLGVLRGYQVAQAAGSGAFAGELLVGFGLLSMGVAAIFVLGQRDYKRMLAYSSVEHMGIMALGIGVGGLGHFGSILHAVNHSLAKAALFLVAGNVLAVYRTKLTADVQGVLRVLPLSGGLLLAGFLAITGTPPFGAFLSELAILKAMVDGGRLPIAAGYLALLAAVFAGMAWSILGMAHGPRPAGLGPAPIRDSVLAVTPPAVLVVLTFLMGVWVPPFLREVIEEAARSLGAS